MNKFSFSRPDDAVKAMNAAFSEVRSSDEFSWITELFWGTVYRVDDDMTADEVIEVIESMLYVCVDGYSETYDNRVSVSFFDNVHSWAESFVTNILINLECDSFEYDFDTVEKMIEDGFNGDDQAISLICEYNKHIIHEAAQYFVYVFCKHYGTRYEYFWENQVI